MSILTSIQESAEGWRMFFSGESAIFSGDSSSTIKAGGVSALDRSELGAPKVLGGVPVIYREPIVSAEDRDPGTPASVVERIQKTISNSAEGWRMGFAHAAGKAKEAAAIVQREVHETAIGLGYGAYLTGEEIKKGVGGIGESFGNVGSGIGEAFGNIGSGFQSIKWPLYALVAVFVFVAVMVSIGYSGVGAPAARVAEREYVRRA